MQQTVSEILMAISQELARLTTLASALQSQLSARDYNARDIEGLQGLDLLHQTLDCLTAYAADTAASSPCQCRIDIDTAVSKMCLSGLANRLQNKSTPCPHDPELF